MASYSDKGSKEQPEAYLRQRDQIIPLNFQNLKAVHADETKAELSNVGSKEGKKLWGP